jgi:ABC-type glycerol-3-phosphate transport system substrate-binding protein
MTDTKKTSGQWTRRRLLTTAASGVALAAAGGLAMPAIAQQRKLTYWGGMVLSDVAHKLLIDAVSDWGAANGVETEVVLINVNEITQKVSAAISAGTLPDVFDVGLELLTLLSRQGVFANVDDVYERIGTAHGGWYGGTARASDMTHLAGFRTAIPFGVSGNLLMRRRDLLEPAGFSEAPKTWDELVVQAAAINKAPISGLGLALSSVGDGNLQTSVLQSFGGRIADDEGKKVTLDSAETRAWLTWLKDAWDKGLFAPGVTVWDGSGDNQAYLSGQVGFIANTGSVAVAARKDDPELFEATAFSALPAGPIGTISPVSPQSRVINAKSPLIEESKSLLEHLANSEFMNEYFQHAIWGPVLADQEKLPAFDGSNTILNGLLDLAKTGTAPAYPDVFNAAYADMSANFLIPKLIQRVVVDGWDFDRAIAEAHAQGQAIYDKYA